jgi:drug/metabolite transporter (DMT)-like permease
MEKKASAAAPGAMQSSDRSFVFLILAFVLAGSSVIPGKVLSGLPPFCTAAGSAAVGLLVLIPSALREAGMKSLFIRGNEARVEMAVLQRALPLLAAQALFGIVLFRVFLLLALARAGAAEVGIATSATPAITAVLASLFLKEQVGARKALGIAGVVAGVALLESAVQGGAAASDGREGLVGLAFALGAAVSESIFNVMAKRIPSTLGSKTTSAVVTALAFAMLVFLSAVTGERIDAADLHPARLAALAYYGLFASALAYLCWYRGIQTTPASTAGVFSGLMPLTGFVLSMVVFGERPGILGVTGAVCALGGMTVCAINSSRS